jgi:hypothetical protein
MAYNSEDMITFPTRLFHYALFGTLMSAAIEVYLATLDYRLRILMNLAIVLGIIKEEYMIWDDIPIEKIDATLRADDKAPINYGSSNFGNQRLPEPHMA